MLNNRLTPSRLLVIFVTGALGLALLYHGFINPAHSDAFSVLQRPGGWLIPALFVLVAALTAGLILGGLAGMISRGLLRLVFGKEPGKYFLERESRADKKLRSHLAHAAGYRFDRNFPNIFGIAFKNYFRYETNVWEFQDQLCLTALAGSDSPLYDRLRRLALAVEVRANLVLLLLLYTLGRLVLVLVHPALAFTLPVILELAAGFLLTLGLAYSLIRVQAAWFHELYLSFFQLAVEEDVDRPTVKISRRSKSGDSRRRRSGGRRRRPSGGRSGGGSGGRSGGRSRGGSSGRSSEGGGSKGGSGSN